MNMAKEISTLNRLSPAQLRERYAEVFGERSRSGNKHFLIKRIAWRIQANEEGGLSSRALDRARELAADSHLRLNPPPLPIAGASPSGAPRSRYIGDGRLPGVGAVITREYRGRTARVKVVEGGFEFQGEVYRSLSAVAKTICGSHCNGFLFFNLLRKSA